jgi:ribosomal protein S18 acetylase RimI-like enzyme
MADALDFQPADPADSDIDAFTSGVAEVDDYFRTRRWFNVSKKKASPETYRFRSLDGSTVVGYASAAFGNRAHPKNGASEKARYLVVYVVGVHEHLQGRRNPDNKDESYATSIFRILERFAREKDGCRGLMLRVRPDNDRAVAFYRRFGFQDDRVEVDEAGERALTMRKPL